MKSIIASAATLLSLTASTVATVSKPFYLNLESANKTLNGKRFGTCHEGAGIESLCLSKDNIAQFYYNHTGSNTYGTLVWNLGIGSSPPETIPSAFQFNPSLLSTNVLHPQFFPDYDGAAVSFDASNRLYIETSYDDSVVPANYSKPAKLYNWYVCQTNNIGYLYNTLNWVAGRGNLTPTNPTCQKVNVVRKFV